MKKKIYPPRTFKQSTVAMTIFIDQTHIHEMRSTQD